MIKYLIQGVFIMKRFDLILNSILVIIIVGLVLIVPESHNAKATSGTLSKSLTTSLINATHEEKVLDEIHAVNLEYAQRQDLINKIIAMGNIFFEVLVIRKSEITFSLTRKTRNVAYNYFAGLLVERIIAK